MTKRGLRLSKTLVDALARAIRRSDTSYFFENYSRQAEAAMAAMDKAGYALVRREPTKRMIDAGVDALTLGVHHKGELVELVYTRMMDASLREVK